MSSRKQPAHKRPEWISAPLPRSIFPTSQGALRGAANGKMEFNLTGVESKKNNMFNVPAVHVKGRDS